MFGLAGPGSEAGPKRYLFLHGMMRKSHGRDKRCPQSRLRRARARRTNEENL
jgi:hypothetical protein